MSYDDTQANATRVICAECKKPFDMTKPQPVCIACRGKQ